MNWFKLYWKNLLVLALAIAFTVPAAVDFLAMHQKEAVAVPAECQVKMLSDYDANLKGTAQDTEVYVFDSGVPGGTMLILGGTHPNESAGGLAAIAMVENIHVTAGRVFVIAHNNSSAYTHTSPIDGMQDFFDIQLADGSVRTFRVGNRLTNPVDQWPDRSYFVSPAGRILKNTETPEIRNVDRMYYGTEDGVMTTQGCYAIYNMILTEDISLAMDMHEGSPEFLYLDCTMVNGGQHNTEAMQIGSDMALSMQFDGLEMRTEYSNITSLGLSHRSLGDNTNCYMYLMETYNPSMGPLHGAMNDALIVDGFEQNYTDSYNMGINYINPPEGGYTLESRVVRHMVCLKYLAEAWTRMYPDKPIVFEGVSDYESMMALGLGRILKPVN